MTDLTLGIGSRVKHSEFGAGVVIQVWSDAYDITFMDYGTRQIVRSADELEVLDFASPDPDLISYEQVERMMARVIRRFGDVQETVELGDKWKDGMLTLSPGDSALKGKTMSIESFFHKIVMVRDRLRVMEQRINSSKLSDEEKVNLQQYITRIYGSLTSFNVLFAEKSDCFVGDKGK